MGVTNGDVEVPSTSRARQVDVVVGVHMVVFGASVEVSVRQDADVFQ
jgi:hypothetical protein